jgi:diguanylate cyclase (GGDEF)-like protein
LREQRTEGVFVVDEGKLSAVLSDFARTLSSTDFPIQRILDHLVGCIVEILPITAAGVTLISEGNAPQYIAASDESAMLFERLQSELRDGPCVWAYESGEAVSVADLATDTRFPQFGASAHASGLGAVFTFPLRDGSGRLGALDLYRDTPGELTSPDMAAAQTLADVAAAYLLNAQAREDSHTTSEQFRHGALHDPLTGLPNRVLLQQRLEHAAQRAQRSHTNAAVLFVDLDRFKHVNDTHGHHVGDDLLRAIAQRLTAVVRPGDTLARFSGDEFVFLCEDLQSAADVEVLAARVDGAFIEPFSVGGVQLAVTASVGMAFAGPGEDISDKLVVQADVAMYQAKRRGGGRHQIIDLREALMSADRNSLEVDLRTAFVGGMLDLAYQPIVRNRDGSITGVEALLRWNDPVRGSVPALTMVAAAEQSGLISQLGAWVLERSCLARREWLKTKPGATLDLAVNVSPRQLMSPDFCPIVASVLARAEMDPGSLTLELAENLFIEDFDHAIAVLTDLRSLGVKLALDDFGTGFSSLSYLRRLPIDIIKIDHSFIADIGELSTGSAIVAAVTNLAHVLGLAVTAEGVETQSQRDEVTAIGCESAQGYFFARPMTASAVSAQLQTATA